MKLGCVGKLEILNEMAPCLQHRDVLLEQRVSMQLSAREFISSYFWRVQAATDLTTLGELLFDATRRLQFHYVWCGSHVEPFNPPPGSVLFHNLSAEWVARYSSLGGAKADPMMRFAERAMRGFTWDDPDFLNSLTVRQKVLRREARRHGFFHGYTMPMLSSAGIFASCSLASSGDELDMEAVSIAIPLIWQVYGRAIHLSSKLGDASIDSLSSRERDCLHLKATGATNLEIAEQLGIRAATVSRHLDQAQLRLSAKSRTHAVALAVRMGQI